MDVKVVELPGHTKGSIGIEIKNNLFVGDALMNMFYPTVFMLYVDEQEMLLSAKYTLPEEMKAMLPEPEEIVKRLKIFEGK